MAAICEKPLGISLFCLGVLTGVCAARLPEPSDPSSAANEPRESVAVELTGPTTRAIEKSLDRVTAPPASGSARGLAGKALDFTVHIRGGKVYGAGIVLDKRGHVLTADHVIDGVPKVEVTFHGGSKATPAKVMDRDKKLDLALLRIDVPVRDVAPVGSVSDLSMGDEVFAMGSPRKMQFSLSRGIVSYVGRSFDGALYIQSDLPANSGSSGGPVMNDQGEVVGVSSFILRNSQGLSFSVPIDYAFVRFHKQLGRRDTTSFDRWLDARRSGPASP